MVFRRRIVPFFGCFNVYEHHFVHAILGRGEAMNNKTVHLPYGGTRRVCRRASDLLMSLFDFSKAHTRRTLIVLASGAIVGLGIAGYGLFTAKGTATRGIPPEAIAMVNGRSMTQRGLEADLASYDPEVRTTTPNIATGTAAVPTRMWRTPCGPISRRMLSSACSRNTSVS
jgi:hypothetical protein